MSNGTSALATLPLPEPAQATVTPDEPAPASDMAAEIGEMTADLVVQFG